MTKFEVISFFVVFLRTIIISALLKSTDTNMFHKTNDKILDVLDNLFIALKIDKSFSKSKIVEDYMFKHSLVQDALCNNNKKYKEISDISKTNISYKIAYYISNINEVVEEMIRKENIAKPENVLNESNTLGENEDFVNLARRFNLNVKILATPTSTKSLSRDEGRRIFEGSSTGIKRYPFMVSVHVAGRFVCAGSLLHESLALSAASCLMHVRDVKALIQIRLASDYVSKMGYLVNIDETIFHPEFDRTSLANNLVILRTRKALRYRKQRVVAIQYDRAAASALKPNVEDMVILGWGRRRVDEEDLSEKDRPLSEARLEVYNFSACQYIYTRSLTGPDVDLLASVNWLRFGDLFGETEGFACAIADEVIMTNNYRKYILKDGTVDICRACRRPGESIRDFVTDKTFCAGFVDRGAGACNHDAGGPALVANVLVGVISFGSPQCGATEAPTVFSRLGLYDHWIDSIVQKLSQSSYGVLLSPSSDQLDGTILLHCHRSYNSDLSTEQRMNVSRNDFRTIKNVDEELKDVYRQNLFPDDILYGPIETLDDNEVPKASYKSFLQEYPSDPSMVPNPELEALLNLRQPVALNLNPSNEIPSDGYWKDYSFEQADLSNDKYIRENQFTSTIVPAKITNQESYENSYQGSTKSVNEDNESTVISGIGHYFDNEPNDIKGIIKNNYNEESYMRELITTTVVPTVHETPNDSDDESQQTGLLENSEIEIRFPEESEIEITEDNERAIVVMVDDGTTQRIDVHRNDPVYKRGFKLLASKIHLAQQLV